MKSPEEFSKTFALNLQNLNLCEWTQKSIFIKYSPGDVDMAAPQFNTWGSGFQERKLKNRGKKRLTQSHNWIKSLLSNLDQHAFHYILPAPSLLILISKKTSRRNNSKSQDTLMPKIVSGPMFDLTTKISKYP